MDPARRLLIPPTSRMHPPPTSGFRADGRTVEPRREFIEANAREVPVPGRLMSELIPPHPLSASKPRELEERFRSSFLDYAMHVIVSPRAPRRARRAEAGTPPRASTAMYDNGLQPNARRGSAHASSVT